MGGLRATNTMGGSGRWVGVAPFASAVSARPAASNRANDLNAGRDGCVRRQGSDMPAMLHSRALNATAREPAVTEVLIVFTTFAKEEDAARVARQLVEERLIACANLLPGARSIYRWKEGVQDEREVVVLMKTRKQDWTALLSRLHELHPFDTPECVAVRVAAGAPKYMAWLDEALAPEGS